ncbi:hypothetical protein MMA231_00960 [Asticcacaulis sp. MM231]|uniref:VpaChn25_0724 family phage protein n=1 Tax=Asticcacaulis sp. MM231 TaxID=3157666 RepID=UPI0032D59862
MSGLADIIDRSLRLALLRVLADPDLNYRANSAVLHGVATSLGFHVSRDKVHSTLDWLREQGLIEIEDLGNVRIAKLRARGIDVALGAATVTGVDRPTPGI